MLYNAARAGFPEFMILVALDCASSSRLHGVCELTMLSWPYSQLPTRTGSFFIAAHPYSGTRRKNRHRGAVGGDSLGPCLFAVIQFSLSPHQFSMSVS